MKYKLSHKKRIKVPLALCLLIAFALIGQPLAGSQNALASDGREKPVKPNDKKHPLKELWSGYYYTNPDLKAMQDNDLRNPAKAWEKYGKKLWSKKEGEEDKACASCHNKAEVSMKGVATRYPVFYEPKNTVINLNDRINLCRQKFMKADTYQDNSEEMTSLLIYLKKQSSGLPLKVKVNGPAKNFFDKGKKFYYTPRGQLNMSCASCHEQSAGKYLRADRLSQGHSNGYPAYRLAWEKPGSLNMRVNACSTLIRAKPLSPQSEDYKALELYLGWRGQGLQVETPSVRR